MNPCGAKTTTVECHEQAGHDGMHCGLLAVGQDKFAEISWSDDWHVDEALPWVTETDMVNEEPIFPVVVFSKGEEGWGTFKDWMNT